MDSLKAASQKLACCHVPAYGRKLVLASWFLPMEACVAMLLYL